MHVDLEKFIDVDAELSRLEKLLAQLVKQITGKEQKLNNENFVSRAPEEVVQRERESLGDLKKQRVCRGRHPAIADEVLAEAKCAYRLRTIAAMRLLHVTCEGVSARLKPGHEKSIRRCCWDRIHRSGPCRRPASMPESRSLVFLVRRLRNHRPQPHAWVLPKPMPRLDELLADADVDVVHITSPNRFHFDQASRVIAAGKHVLCEKPLAMDSQESASWWH